MAQGDGCGDKSTELKGLGMLLESRPGWDVGPSEETGFYYRDICLGKV